MTSIDSDAGLVQSYADFAGLARLRGQAHGNEVDATRATAQQFEAMFIQMMLKSMRAASFRSDLVESQTLETYEAMQDQELSVQMAKRGALGIAGMLERQLTQMKSGAQPPATSGDTSSSSDGRSTLPNVNKSFSIVPAPPAAMALQPAARAGIPLRDAARPSIKNLEPAYRVLNRD